MKPLQIQGLSKEYSQGFRRRRVTTLDRLDLEIEGGEIFGFLGPNGAGKTTTIKMVLGLLRPSAGRAWIWGRSIDDVDAKQDVGYLPESPFFYEYLTAEEFLGFYGQLFGMSGKVLARKVDELLDLVSMTHARALPLRKFSKGMLQRVGIAQALLNDPKLVILDEPMSGLDPIGRRDVRDIILRLRDSGKTIFFSTHILSDVEVICDRIAMLVKGRLRAVGTVQDLVRASSVTAIEIVVEAFPEVADQDVAQEGAFVIRRGVQTLIEVNEAGKVDAVLDLIRRHKGRVISLVPHKRSLEDLFIAEAGARAA